MEDREDLAEQVRELKGELVKVTAEVRRLHGVPEKVDGLVDLTGGIKDELHGLRDRDEARDVVTQAIMDAATPQPARQQGGPPRPRSADG